MELHVRRNRVALIPVLAFFVIAQRQLNGASAAGSEAEMAGIVFEGVSKVYRDGTRAVDDLDLEIDDGEFLVLVGPSGAGRRRRCGWSPASRRSARARSVSATGS